MHAFRLAIAAALVLGLGACGSDEPLVMPDVTGQKLDVALSDIERAGFDDDPEVIGGGMFGVIDESNWTICGQEPAAKKEISEKPRLTVDRSCEDDAEETEEPTESPGEDASEDPSEDVTPSEEPDAEEVNPDQVLTAKNNKELAGLLKVADSCSPAAKAFASKYEGRKIQFDGSIANVAPHGSYETRFDYLIAPGDAGPLSTVGPIFKYEDVGSVGLLSGKKIPDYIRAGLLVRVTAEVSEYNQRQCVFFLDPVTTTVR